jgi:hypothetical protein
MAPPQTHSGHIFPILGIDSELMVSRHQVNLGEYCSTPYLVKQVIDPQQGILFLDGPLIEFSIICAQFECPIFIFHKQG